MGIRKTLDVINTMEAEGVIGRYAIAGAVAAYNYIEPAPTEDLDIIIAIDETAGSQTLGLVTLEPTHDKEGILIGDWRVQFLPVASDLDREALVQAEDIQLEMGDKQTTSWRWTNSLQIRWRSSPSCCPKITHRSILPLWCSAYMTEKSACGPSQNICGS